MLIFQRRAFVCSWGLEEVRPSEATIFPPGENINSKSSDQSQRVIIIKHYVMVEQKRCWLKKQNIILNEILTYNLISRWLVIKMIIMMPYIRIFNIFLNYHHSLALTILGTFVKVLSLWWFRGTACRQLVFEPFMQYCAIFKCFLHTTSVTDSLKTHILFQRQNVLLCQCHLYYCDF